MSDVKDEKPEGSEHINLKVRSQDGKEVYFKIRRSTPLRKLFGTYCTREGVDPNSVKFVVDGERLEDTSTPDSLDMENDDIIDVMQTMTGGQ